MKNFYTEWRSSLEVSFAKSFTGRRLREELHWKSASRRASLEAGFAKSFTKKPASPSTGVRVDLNCCSYARQVKDPATCHQPHVHPVALVRSCKDEHEKSTRQSFLVCAKGHGAKWEFSKAAKMKIKIMWIIVCFETNFTSCKSGSCQLWNFFLEPEIFVSDPDPAKMKEQINI